MIIAGAASGGAGLVVSSKIADGNFPADLAGQTLATPSLGNTQDISLRTWLQSKGLTTSVNGGGQVNIDTSSGNSVSLQNFEAGKIAGGWVPEPYESEFILQGKGTLAVDEASLWPNGQFPTTVLVVTQNLLQNHPDIVSDLLKGLVKSVNWINSNEFGRPGGGQHRTRVGNRRQATQGQRARTCVDPPQLPARPARRGSADRCEQCAEAWIQQLGEHQGHP